MTPKKTIRIVKKTERGPATATPEVNTTRQVTRQMVGRVTNWVIDFQQKRREETSSALKILSREDHDNTDSNVDVLSSIIWIP
jgi:hypothetical protein